MLVLGCCWKAAQEWAAFLIAERSFSSATSRLCADAYEVLNQRCHHGTRFWNFRGLFEGGLLHNFSQLIRMKRLLKGEVDMRLLALFQWLCTSCKANFLPRLINPLQSIFHGPSGNRISRGGIGREKRSDGEYRSVCRIFEHFILLQLWPLRQDRFSLAHRLPPGGPL